MLFANNSCVSSTLLAHVVTIAIRRDASLLGLAFGWHRGVCAIRPFWRLLSQGESMVDLTYRLFTSGR